MLFTIDSLSIGPRPWVSGVGMLKATMHYQRVSEDFHLGNAVCNDTPPKHDCRQMDNKKSSKSAWVVKGKRLTPNNGLGQLESLTKHMEVDAGVRSDLWSGQA